MKLVRNSTNKIFFFGQEIVKLKNTTLLNIKCAARKKIACTLNCTSIHIPFVKGTKPAENGVMEKTDSAGPAYAAKVLCH